MGRETMVATGAGEPSRSIRRPRRCSAPHAARDWHRRRSSSKREPPLICSWSSRNLPKRPWYLHQRIRSLPRSQALSMPIPMLAPSAAASSQHSPCPSNCIAPGVVLVSREIGPHRPLDRYNRQLPLNLFNGRPRPSRSSHNLKLAHSHHHHHHRLLSLRRRHLRQPPEHRGSVRTVGAP